MPTNDLRNAAKELLPPKEMLAADSDLYFATYVSPLLSKAEMASLLKPFGLAPRGKGSLDSKRKQVSLIIDRLGDSRKGPQMVYLNGSHYTRGDGQWNISMKHWSGWTDETVEKFKGDPKADAQAMMKGLAGMMEGMVHLESQESKMAATPRIAAETKHKLINKLAREAIAHPEKRAEILPLLQKLGVDASKIAAAKSVKVAGKDTEEFGRWVLSTQSVMSPHEVETVVSRSLGVKTSPPVKARPGPRFQDGDKVIVCAEKHTGSGKGTYDLYDQKIGTCVGADGMDLMLSLPGEQAPVRFEGGMKPKGVGVYKYTAAYTMSGSAAMEMYYFAGGKPTDDAKIIVDAYIGRSGKKETRSANYYTGHVVFASVGEKGYYFRGFPQQRLQVEAKGCKGDTFLPRTFNPLIGDIYYIGVLGHRPAKWKDELAALDEAAGANAPKD